jgi:hypothetical protein
VSDLGATSVPGAIVGTDAAVASSFSAPIVEVVMGSDAEARTAATAPRIATGDRLASILARGKEGDAKPAESKPDEPPPDEAVPEDPPADGEAKPDAPPEDKSTDEAKPDPAAAAVHAAELEAARAEAVLLRRQLEATGTVTDDDRLGYVDKPLDAVRGFIAARLGVKPDAKEVADELAFLRQELLIDAIGADTLADDRKLQRSQEHTDRRWRLGQQLQAASKETQRATEQRTAAVRLVSSVIDATKADHPYLQLATAFGEDPAQVALDLWVSEVQAGRIKPTGDDAATAREALRLANQFYQHRADRIAKIRPVDTSQAPATTPTKASAPAGQPGQLKQTPSKAPAKAASAPPPTLSARQAAAPPSAKAPSDGSPRVIVDPHDPANRAARIAAAIAKRQQG